MTKEIELTQGYVALVNDEDYERVNQYKWHIKIINGVLKAAQRTINKPPRTTMMHRFIMRINNYKIYIDHKNMNVLDNRKENLRSCTDAQNKCNSVPRKGRSSKYKGVYKTENKYWVSKITKNKKGIYLGYYKNEVQAVRAYDKAAKELHGEFARLNFG